MTFKTQPQSLAQSHPRMPTGSSSGTMQKPEMSVLSEVEKPQQDIVPNAFGAQASPQNDASGQDTQRLSKPHLGITKTIVNGTKKLVSIFRDRFRLRSHLLFCCNRDLERLVSTLNLEALNDVHIATGQLWPTFSMSNTKLIYSMLINMQYQDPSMAERPFEYLFENRLTWLLEYLGCDSNRVCSIRKNLMFIYNQKVSRIADSIGI
ncbi:hypothetical protein EAE96_000671 [Botrytis aclada]|nr:hypothetical protein EAE96_000671 [Botrytis aclada]